MLRKRIKSEADLALKSGNSREVEVLRFLVSLLDKKELSMPAGKMTEADELAVLQKELKHKEEAKKMFADGGRADLVAEVDYEIEVLKQYLPAEMEDDEIRKVVVEVVGAQSIAPVPFGVVMGETMKRLGGRVSGDRVALIVKECLM